MPFEANTPSKQNLKTASAEKMDARQKLINSFYDASRKAFDPDTAAGDRAQAVQDFHNLVDRQVWRVPACVGTPSAALPS